MSGTDLRIEYQFFKVHCKFYKTKNPFYEINNFEWYCFMGIGKNFLFLLLMPFNTRISIYKWFYENSNIFIFDTAHNCPWWCEDKHMIFFNLPTKLHIFYDWILFVENSFRHELRRKNKKWTQPLNSMDAIDFHRHSIFHACCTVLLIRP